MLFCVCFFPLCLSLLPWLLFLVGKDQYLIQSTLKTVSKSVIAGTWITDNFTTFTDYVRQLDELLAQESEKIAELRGECCGSPCFILHY